MKIRYRVFTPSAAAFAAIMLYPLNGALAQSAAEFYAGKDLDLFIGSAPGGGYDQYARLLGRHLGRHIPGNPTFIARNMPGGSGRAVMNHVYTIAPRDGSAIATTLRNVPFDPLMGAEVTKIDATQIN